MKVKELITQLMELNQESEIFIQGVSADDGGTGEVLEVYELHGEVTIVEKSVYGWENK